MSEPLFSDIEKNKLAGFKVVYKHNLAEARRYALCSLQAAEALSQIIRLFSSVIEKIRTPKNVTYILVRLKDNSDIDIKLVSEGIEGQKIELKEKLDLLTLNNKRNINRLRKNLR